MVVDCDTPVMATTLLYTQLSNNLEDISNAWQSRLDTAYGPY